ncbi:MAG: hypothetical protein JW891_01260 [Candidatus Lokiarchaeota archaeon]|nr:hypothetical protein [Candidatus Lokiarchaeota archaeon]
MTTWYPFIYKDFWDVPRAIFFTINDRSFFLDCDFDDTIDDYPNDYKLYLMPDLSESDLKGSWAGLNQKSIQNLGTIPVNEVKFDPSLRKCIDIECINHLLNKIEFNGT